MTPNEPHPLDPTEGEPSATGDAAEAGVDPADAGFPSSPDLDDDNTVVTEPGADPEPGAAAG
jgi:hypothetical protein